MKIRIRLTAFILCMLVMIPIIAACADEAGQTPYSTIATEAGETTEQENSYDPNLPDFNFEGGTFTILTKAVATYNEWGEVSIWTEAENGDAVNDAISAATAISKRSIISIWLNISRVR